jgi:hypothetical protein
VLIMASEMAVTEPQPRGQVKTYRMRGAPPIDGPPSHEGATLEFLARRLASLKDFEFGGEFDGEARPAADIYLIPTDTLLQSRAAELGISRESQFFGGCVSEPFITTKSITHPLLPDGVAPIGWRPSFAQAVAKVVLGGFSVFSRKDARRAAEQLLAHGPVRLKPALGVGGSGQVRIDDSGDIDAALDTLDDDALALFGAVLEEHLEEVITYSVGQVHTGDFRIAYYGIQRLTANHQGEAVYGGSTLRVLRGDLQDLRQLDLSPEIALAVEQACRYNMAANAFLDGFFASRRNYDIAQGIDARGERRSGVLEQSWRLGGATPAEVAALEAFKADPSLRAVQASCCEVYNTDPAPAEATVSFSGIDPRVGALTKYSWLEAHEYSAH